MKKCLSKKTRNSLLGVSVAFSLSIHASAIYFMVESPTFYGRAQREKTKKNLSNEIAVQLALDSEEIGSKRHELIFSMLRDSSKIVTNAIPLQRAPFIYKSHLKNVSIKVALQNIFPDKQFQKILRSFPSNDFFNSTFSNEIQSFIASNTIQKEISPLSNIEKEAPLPINTETVEIEKQLPALLASADLRIPSSKLELASASKNHYYPVFPMQENIDSPAPKSIALAKSQEPKSKFPNFAIAENEVTKFQEGSLFLSQKPCLVWASSIESSLISSSCKADLHPSFPYAEASPSLEQTLVTKLNVLNFSPEQAPPSLIPPYHSQLDQNSLVFLAKSPHTKLNIENAKSPIFASQNSSHSKQLHKSKSFRGISLPKSYDTTIQNHLPIVALVCESSSTSYTLEASNNPDLIALAEESVNPQKKITGEMLNRFDHLYNSVLTSYYTSKETKKTETPDEIIPTYQFETTHFINEKDTHLSPMIQNLAALNTKPKNITVLETIRNVEKIDASHPKADIEKQSPQIKVNKLLDSQAFAFKGKEAGHLIDFHSRDALIPQDIFTDVFSKDSLERSAICECDEYAPINSLATNAKLDISQKEKIKKISPSRLLKAKEKRSMYASISDIGINETEAIVSTDVFQLPNELACYQYSIKEDFLLQKPGGDLALRVEHPPATNAQLEQNPLTVPIESAQLQLFDKNKKSVTTPRIIKTQKRDKTKLSKQVKTSHFEMLSKENDVEDSNLPLSSIAQVDTYEPVSFKSTLVTSSFTTLDKQELEQQGKGKINYQSLSTSFNQEMRKLDRNIDALAYADLGETAFAEEDFSSYVHFAKLENGDGYLFSIELAPSDIIKQVHIPQNYLFLIDASKTVQKNRFASYVKGVIKSLSYLQEGDSFNIVCITSKPIQFSDTNVEWDESNCKKAKAFLQELSYTGLFSKARTLDNVEAVSNTLLDESRANTVVLLSPGNDLDGLKKRKTAYSKFLDSNRGLYTLVAATASENNNFAMLEMITAMGGGELMLSPTNVAFPRRLAIFVKHLRTLYAKNVTLSVKSNQKEVDVNLYPNFPFAPNIYSDSSYKIFGTVDKLEDFDLILQAKSGNKWINIQKTISFEDAKSVRYPLKKDYVKQSVNKNLITYLQTSDESLLKNAEQIIKQFEK